MKRRELTTEERGEAERLAAAWQSYKALNKGSTQEWLAHESRLGTQGAVGQYLRGVIPLNLEALMAISRVIGADPKQISPRLTAIVGDLIHARREEADEIGLPGSLDITCRTAREILMLQVHRLASPSDRAAIDAFVDNIRRRLSAEGVLHKR